MKQKPIKRMVSKWEYAEQIVKKTGLSLGSVGLGAIATTLGLIGLILVFVGLLCINGSQRNDEIFGSVQTLPSLGCAAVMIALCVFCAYAAKITMLKADDIPLDIPITRANTGHLLASDNLVRASSEPLQAQQSVLLRAAIEATSEQEAELLRASAEGRE